MSVSIGSSGIQLKLRLLPQGESYLDEAAVMEMIIISTLMITDFMF